MPCIKVSDLLEESPIKRAKRMRWLPGLPPTSKTHLMRIDALSPEFVDLMDQEEFAYRVCRWIAWGKFLQDRAIRLGIAMLLRYEADPHGVGIHGRRSPSGWVWPDDRVLVAAERVFRASDQFQRLVQANVLDARKVPDNKLRFTFDAWPGTWNAIQSTMATLDRTRFLAEAQRNVQQRRRKHPRKRIKLKPAEVAFVNAFKLIQEAVIRGDVQVRDIDFAPGSQTIGIIGGRK